MCSVVCTTPGSREVQKMLPRPTCSPSQHNWPETGNVVLDVDAADMYRKLLD